MRITTRMMVGAVIAALLAVGMPARAKKKPFPADKGASKVDVRTFPAKIQRAYRIFAAKCSKCHTLARPINTNMKVSGWKTYVKRMMNKPDSGISPRQGRKIYRFLKYYQRIKDAKRAKK